MIRELVRLLALAFSPDFAFRSQRRCGPERPCARCTRLGLECMTLPDGRRRGAQAGLSLAKQIAKQRTSY